MYKILKATNEDKYEILKLYKSMLYGPADWDEHYPSEETIEFDLSRNSLIKMCNEKNEIIAVISIDEDENVDKLKCWNESILPGGELSRLCVRNDMQNKGLSKLIMKYAFEELKNRNLKSVHILVRKGHSKALKSYETIGFKKVDECNLYEKDFICMEMKI